MTWGFKGGGIGLFPPALPPPKLSIRFCMIMLWASPDGGLIWFFINGLKE
jgi:hypothetical protein